MPIGQIIEKSGINKSNYYKFTIERHPYDRAVSIANFNIKRSEYENGISTNISLDEIPLFIDRLIESGEMIKKIQNYKLYSINGQVAVDHVIRYENLTEQFAAIIKSLGINEILPLPLTKVGERNKEVLASDILTAKQKE